MTWLDFFKNKKIATTLFLFFSILFLVFLGSIADWSSILMLVQHPLLLIVVLSCTFSFALIKSLAWWMCLRSQTMKISFPFCFRLFLVSSFVEVVGFPSKIVGDGYRAYALGGHGTNTGIFRGMMIFRIATILPFFLILSFAFGRVHYVLLIVALVIVLGTAFLFYRKRIALGTSWEAMLFSILLTFLALAVDFMRIVAIGTLFGMPLSLTFFFWYIGSHAVGVLSGLPGGIIVKDISLGAYLSEFMTLPDVSLFLFLSRITGDILVGIVGWVLAGKSTAALFSHHAPPTFTEEKMDLSVKKSLAQRPRKKRALKKSKK